MSVLQTEGLTSLSPGDLSLGKIIAITIYCLFVYLSCRKTKKFFFCCVVVVIKVRHFQLVLFFFLDFCFQFSSILLSIQSGFIYFYQSVCFSLFPHCYSRVGVYQVLEHLEQVYTCTSTTRCERSELKVMSLKHVHQNLIGQVVLTNLIKCPRVTN